MPSALGIAKRALRAIRAPFRLANRHQWLTSALIVGSPLTQSATVKIIPTVQEK
jgi:hypothetical protein